MVDWWLMRLLQARREGEGDGEEGDEHDAQRAEVERKQRLRRRHSRRWAAHDFFFSESWSARGRRRRDRQRQRVDKRGVALHGDEHVLAHREVAPQEDRVRHGAGLEKKSRARHLSHTADARDTGCVASGLEGQRGPPQETGTPQKRNARGRPASSSCAFVTMSPCGRGAQSGGGGGGGV